MTFSSDDYGWKDMNMAARSLKGKSSTWGVLVIVLAVAGVQWPTHTATCRRSSRGSARRDPDLTRA